MTSLAILLDEHRTIERMLAHLEAAAARLERGQDVPTTVLGEMLDFFRSFADAGHHAKEELLLFPLIEKHGLTRDLAPVSACLAQHRASRAYQREMREGLGRIERGERPAERAFAASARDFIALLREHIRIEDEYFFRLVARVLQPEEDRALAARMAAMDRQHAQQEWAKRQSTLLQHCADVAAGWQVAR
jgi:hemerythrin-like domain-containing protein